MNYLAWSIIAWHITLSFHCAFDRDKNRSLDAASKILMDDSGFGLVDSRVRRRSWIRLEKAWTCYFDECVAIDGEKEIEGCDGMKAVSFAICCLRVTVSNMRESHTSWENDASTVSDFGRGSIRNAVGCWCVRSKVMLVIMIVSGARNMISCDGVSVLNIRFRDGGFRVWLQGK